MGWRFTTVSATSPRNEGKIRQIVLICCIVISKGNVERGHDPELFEAVGRCHEGSADQGDRTS